MKEKDALRKLVPPGKGRPGKMGYKLGGVMQIHVTRACDMACRNCTQGSNLGGKTSFMDPEQFGTAVVSLRNYPWIIALFGGNPTLSPHFAEYCKILSRWVPFERRGIWTNSLNGQGAVCRETFNPSASNVNVHMSQKAYDEICSTWPEAHPFGLDSDSRHSPVFVALKDVVPDESLRWAFIADCDINRDWSALVGIFRGQVRGYFCEIAYAQSALHQDDPEYPDTGLDIEASYRHPDTGNMVKWWQLPMESFAEQARKHCHECSVPLKGYGALALDAEAKDQVSHTHQSIYKPKRKGHKVEIVTSSEQLGSQLRSFLDYIGNARRPKKEVIL